MSGPFGFDQGQFWRMGGNETSRIGPRVRLDLPILANLCDHKTGILIRQERATIQPCTDLQKDQDSYGLTCTSAVNSIL